MIKNNPGIKVPSILDKLSYDYNTITIDMIRNSIKREIGDCVELRGSKKLEDIILFASRRIKNN